jgi:tetratricopeptide (TPR) repeat protein
MKKFLLSIAILCGWISYSQTSHELFSEANNLYQTEEYNKAIDLYLSIEEQGLESEDLYFNLGNCYYKLNKVAPSIYYYEKALKINPLHQDAKTNLTFAKRMTIDKIDTLPKTFLQRISENIIQKLPYDTWAIIAVIASFLASILFLVYRYSYTTRRKLIYFNSTILAVVILILSVIFAFEKFDIVQKNRTAIIFSPKTDIKNAPTSSGDDIFELHEGTKVLILDELDGWKKIKLSDGKIGWLYSEDLKEI